MDWAHDFFDAFARGNQQLGLWLVHEDGSEDPLSFDALATRSYRVANFLRAHGVQRGDVVLVMLGNVAPLWETMLAAIKLGLMLPAARAAAGAPATALQLPTPKYSGLPIDTPRLRRIPYAVTRWK